MLFTKIEKINTHKRLPILVAIDSATLKAGFTLLGESKYDIAKIIVDRLLHDIRNNEKLYNTVEICFINNEETRHSDFCWIDECIFNSAEICPFPKDIIQFTCEKMSHRIKKLREMEIGYYTPLIIFVGDEEFETINKNVYKENHVHIVIINIGKASWDPIENSDVESFSVATKAIAERFDIGIIIQYILDGVRLDSNTYLNEIKRFHNYCGELRKRLEKDTSSSAKMAQDKMINTIREDMDMLLADLMGE